MDGRKENVMANKRRLTLPILAAFVFGPIHGTRSCGIAIKGRITGATYLVIAGKEPLISPIFKVANQFHNKIFSRLV